MLPHIKLRQNKENVAHRRLVTETRQTKVMRYPRSHSIREYQEKTTRPPPLKTQQSEEEGDIVRSPWARANQYSALSYDLYKFKQQPTDLDNEYKKVETYQQKSTQAYIEFIKVKLLQLNYR